jgi:hypothetical protein
MFRHSYATRLLRAGVKAEVVQKLLGHASVSTTIDTYPHLKIEDVRRDLVRAFVLEQTGPWMVTYQLSGYRPTRRCGTARLAPRCCSPSGSGPSGGSNRRSSPIPAT